MLRQLSCVDDSFFFGKHLFGNYGHNYHNKCYVAGEIISALRSSLKPGWSQVEEKMPLHIPLMLG